MFENTSELAENKLLLLYISKTIDEPISNAQLTDIVLENSLINYFTLQQYLSELDTSEFIHYEKINDKNLITLTNKGIKVLSFFEDRISPSKKTTFDTYIAAKKESIKKELNIQSDLLPTGNDNYLVDLKAFEDDSTLMDLKISVPSKKHALSLCSNWQKNSSKIYNDIINYLLNQEENNNDTK